MGWKMNTKATLPQFSFLLRSVLRQGPAFALVMLFALSTMAASRGADRSSAPSTATAQAKRASAQKSGKGAQQARKDQSTSQDIALGTVSMAQTSSGYRLFGSSGLTLNHSSVFSQKLYESPDPLMDRGYSYSFGMGLRLSKDYFTSLSFSLDHQPNALEERDQLKLRNVSLGFTRNPINLRGGWSLTPGLGFRLPVGHEVVNNESLRLGLAPSATIGLPPLWSGSRLGASYSVSGTYNNHEYTHAASGNPNVEWGFNHGVRLAYPLVRGLTVSVGGNHGLAWTTLGTVREYVGHSESLNWQVSPNASLSIGHTNQGSMYALDGVVYDFSFLSERNSIVYGRLGLSI